MKRTIVLFALSLSAAISGGGSLHAQSPQASIFDSFEKTPKRGEGTVVIHQPEAVKALVGTRLDSESGNAVDGKAFLPARGYRIQVYSGNNQRTSKGEAFDKQSKIKELYPDLSTYVTYNAPFWKLHVGDFRSFEEASFMLRQLCGAFPHIKNEIYIIEDDIRL